MPRWLEPAGSEVLDDYQKVLLIGLCQLTNAGLAVAIYRYTGIAIGRWKIGVELGEHTTRHTHATLLLRANVPVHVVSARLGHSDIKVTLGFYAHVIPSDDEAAALEFDAIAAASCDEDKPGAVKKLEEPVATNERAGLH